MATKGSRKPRPARRRTPRHRGPPLTNDEIMAAWEWFRANAFGLEEMTETQVLEACRFIAYAARKPRLPVPLTPPPTPEEIQAARALILEHLTQPVVLSPNEHDRVMHWAVTELRKSRAAAKPVEHPLVTRMRNIGARALDIAEEHPDRVIEAGSKIADGINRAAKAHRADPEGTRRFFGEKAISFLANILKKG